MNLSTRGQVCYRDVKQPDWDIPDEINKQIQDWFGVKSNIRDFVVVQVTAGPCLSPIYYLVQLLQQKSNILTHTILKHVLFMNKSYIYFYTVIIYL